MEAMNVLLMLPLLIPLLTGIVCLLGWNSRLFQRGLSVLGAGGLLAASVVLLLSVWRHGIQSTQVGNWPAPFGITIVADLFSAIMVVMTGIMGLAVVVYSWDGIDPQRESFGYHPLLHILLVGVCGAFLTGDIFNLFVWFELMLIASFVLVQLGGEKAQLEGAVKYVTLNILSSALFLTAIAILYGLLGTLNMADLAVQMHSAQQPMLLTTVAMLFLLAFGIKAAVFPLFFWLPASYHTPPAPVSAIFSGLLTKVGVYALIRFFTLLFVHDVGYTHTLILVLSVLTMVTGVLGAVTQNEFRRILSFHIVSQIGYLIMGLGLFTPLALAGSIFFLMHVILAKANLFLVSGVAYRLRGTYELRGLGGLYASHPGLSALFLISALSLAGTPSLSGFWAKFILIRAGLESEQYVVVFAALGVSLLTLLSMMKIWNGAFWKDVPEGPSRSRGEEAGSLPFCARLSLLGPIVFLNLMMIAMGLMPEPVLSLVHRAAEQLVNPAGYIQCVLKGAL